MGLNDRRSAPPATLEPVLDWSELVEGRTFPAVGFTLEDTAIDAYLDATGERHPLYAPGASGGFAPPLYTTLVRLLKASLGGRWPSGTIQLDHTIAMRRAVRRGETLTIDARIARTDTRKGRAYFEVVSLVRAAGEVVGEQSSTSMWAGALPVQAPPTAAGGPGEAPRVGSMPPAGPHRTPGARPSRRLGPLNDRYPLAALRAFGAVAGALDPIHVDPEFGRRTRYGANIVQGRLAMTLLSRLLLEHCGLPWLERGELAVRFVRPVMVGEPISAWAETLEGEDRQFTVWCENARAERVIDGVAGIGDSPDGPPTGPTRRRTGGAA